MMRQALLEFRELRRGTIHKHHAKPNFDIVGVERSDSMIGSNDVDVVHVVVWYSNQRVWRVRIEQQ